MFYNAQDLRSYSCFAYARGFVSRVALTRALCARRVRPTEVAEKAYLAADLQPQAFTKSIAYKLSRDFSFSLITLQGSVFTLRHVG